MTLDPTRILTYQEPARIDLKIPKDVMEFYRVFPQVTVTDEFVTDIRENGIREPLRIMTDGTRAVLRDGHHRLRAAQQTHLAAVPVHVVPNWLGNLYDDPAFAPPDVELCLFRWLKDNRSFLHVGHQQVEVGRNDRLIHFDCSCGATWRQQL